MTTKTPDFSDMNALALEACDMWQEHLSNFANNPDARSEMMRFLEPQRRMFADWASLMQQGVYGTGNARSDTTKPEPAEQSASTEAESASAATAQSSAAHGDDSLRLAQLALRLAELEKRVAQLEAKPSEEAQRA